MQSGRNDTRYLMCTLSRGLQIFSLAGQISIECLQDGNTIGIKLVAISMIYTSSDKLLSKTGHILVRFEVSILPLVKI